MRKIGRLQRAADGGAASRPIRVRSDARRGSLTRKPPWLATNRSLEKIGGSVAAAVHHRAQVLQAELHVRVRVLAGSSVFRIAPSERSLT